MKENLIYSSRARNHFGEVFNENESDCVIGAANVNEPGKFVIVLNKDRTTNRFIEKPREPNSNWLLIGVYIFNGKFFYAVKKIKPSWRSELEIE